MHGLSGQPGRQAVELPAPGAGERGVTTSDRGQTGAVGGRRRRQPIPRQYGGHPDTDSGGCRTTGIRLRTE